MTTSTPFKPPGTQSPSSPASIHQKLIKLYKNMMQVKIAGCITGFVLTCSRPVSSATVRTGSDAHKNHSAYRYKTQAHSPLQCSRFPLLLLVSTCCTQTTTYSRKSKSLATLLVVCVCLALLTNHAVNAQEVVPASGPQQQLHTELSARRMLPGGRPQDGYGKGKGRRLLGKMTAMVAAGMAHQPIAGNIATDSERLYASDQSFVRRGLPGGGRGKHL